MLKRILLTLIVFTLAAAFPVSAEAGSSYPQIKNNGKDIWISSHWLVRFHDSSEYDASYDSTADIIYFDEGAHGDVRGSLNLGNYGGGISCAGKYRGKIYFNVYTDYGENSKALYTIKPGDIRFKKVSKAVNIRKITKKNLLSNRYILGHKNTSGDASGFYAYVYDLKTNKKAAIGNVLDIRKAGKRFYYLKRTVRSSGSIVLRLYKCKLSGKSKQLLKTFTINGVRKDAIGSGRLTSKSIVYEYVGSDEKEHRYVKKYR